MFRLLVRPYVRMENNERLDDGNVPLAQREDLLGSTEQEGGNATKDVAADEMNNEFGSGNRLRTTSGATPVTERAGEGLDDDAKNLGSEIQRTDA